MIRNKLNIDFFKETVNFTKENFKGNFIAVMLILSFSYFSCNNCNNIENPGSNPEEEVFFTASPLNSSSPNIYSTDPQGGSIKNLISNGIAFSSPSLNGKTVFIRKDASNGSNMLFISNISGMNQKMIAKDGDIYTVSFPVMSSNGKYVAFHAGNSRLFYSDISISSSVFNQVSGRLTTGCQPSFSKDSKYLAFFEGDGINFPVTLKVIETNNTDNITVVYTKKLGNVSFSDNSDISINWSYDSKSLVFTVKNGINDDINVINTETGNERIISIPNAEIGGNHAALSPKEDFLAVSGTDGNIWMIFIATNDFRFSKLTNSTGFERNHHPKWSPKGAKIIYNSSSQFDSEIYSTLICAELVFEVALVRTVKSYILSNNSYLGFWNYSVDNK